MKISKRFNNIYQNINRRNKFKILKYIRIKIFILFLKFSNRKIYQFFLFKFLEWESNDNNQ